MKTVSILETKDKIGEVVELYGWVHNRRDHGKIIFIDLRDRSGVAQVVFVPSTSSGQAPKQKEMYELAGQLRGEWVIWVKGKVVERPGNMVNSEIPTGRIEIQPEELKVLSKAETPPFEIDKDGYEEGEDIRLKYRYLDLRRQRLTKNLVLRHQMLKYFREYLDSHGFVEIETPILTKSTPEGARDFVVPSRIYPGKFYALPQSPQQYKQLLMVAGFEKYYQIARALRDEDPRADRGFEHTQIDIEMSFVEQKDVMNTVEEMATEVVEKLGKKITKKPFPVVSYKEALEKYGADKFDLRDDKNDKNELAFAWVVDFPVFERDEKKNLPAGGWTYSHNPFTGTKPEHLDDLMNEKNLGDLVSWQYDLVCNGLEVGGGGIRIHQPEVLEKVFKVMGYPEKKINEQFGHILEAFKYGVPPHGGIALGADRWAMILAGEESMKEVVAFPMSGRGQTAVMDAPSELTKEQLKELRLTSRSRR